MKRVAVLAGVGVVVAGMGGPILARTPVRIGRVSPAASSPCFALDTDDDEEAPDPYGTLPDDQQTMPTPPSTEPSAPDDDLPSEPAAARVTTPVRAPLTAL